MEKYTITYKGIDYLVAEIPNMFYKSDDFVLIGTHSLNEALYDDDYGYPDEEARWIDEQIYAFLDDEYFELEESEFIKLAKTYLD